MKEIRFHKMHGLGNDYIYINLDRYTIKDLPAFARKYSDRRFGIGGDGVITYQKSDQGDYRMRVFNLDGSEALMCGNAIRCVAKLLYESALCQKDEIRIDTLSGQKVLQLTVQEGEVVGVRVDMNPPRVLDAEKEIEVEGERIVGVQVDVGNPHYVHFMTQDPDDYPLDVIGSKVEHHPEFGDGVNFEVVRIKDAHHVKMRVWERGSGLTWACGTGATAIAVAGIATKRLESPVTVAMPGGDLTIEWDESEASSAFMIGGATLVYEGILHEDGEQWIDPGFVKGAIQYI